MPIRPRTLPSLLHYPELIDAINTRRGLKWGVPATLLAVPYALAVIYCRAQIEAGGASWLNLLVILCLWNTLKFLLIGPISLLKLMAARVREALARGRMVQTLPADGTESFGQRMSAG